MAEMYVSMQYDIWIGVHIMIENCSIVILFQDMKTAYSWLQNLKARMKSSC